MPRSSRHKSHRPHKHGSRDVRERSDSEEDVKSREKPKENSGSGTRVSRDPVPEKRKILSLSQPSHGKDLIGSCNGDFSGEHGKKRKDTAEGSSAADRWNDGREDGQMVDKDSKGEGLGVVDSEKAAKSKLLAVDSKDRSSRKREGSSERNDESGGKVEPRRRSEKESSRRESNNQYKDAKERDREHGAERDKKVQDARDERPDDVGSRKQGAQTGSSKEERGVKKAIEISELQLQDELRNPELEKELEKRNRRRDGSGDKDKWQRDDRDIDDRRLLSRDDRTKDGSYKEERPKNGSYKEERHKDGRYRDKYQDELDRDQRHRDDKHRNDRSSRDHGSDRSDGKHFRDENKPSDSRYKKSKPQDSDHDGSPYVDDEGTKFKDSRGRKRSYDENGDHTDLKVRNAKEPRGDMEKNASSSSKLISHTDRARLEYLDSDKLDSSLSKNRPKSSPSSSAHAVKDQSRHSSKIAETTHRESPSKEKLRTSTASSGDLASVSGIQERESESQSLEKTKPKDGIHSGEVLVETPAASLHDRTPRSDGRISPIQLTEKSPSSTSNRRSSYRTGARRSLDIEEVEQRSSTSKYGRECTTLEERDRKLQFEKAIVGDHSQVELLNSEPGPAGSSSFNRTGHISGSSPSHLPPAPPVRIGIDSPSVLGSYEDDNRVQIGDRKSSSRYKRSGDLSMGRGQGNAWKSVSNWPSPVANGFIPFQHAPPPSGFHQVMQQFPTPSLFSVRPSMNLNHTGISYHMHETADRFSGHGRPFGWRNPMDDSCPPHLQGWDGNNGAFGDKSHVYGRPDWDHNMHLMDNRGWEISSDTWKGHNGNMNMEFPVIQKEPDYSADALADEAWGVQSGQRARRERSRSERFLVESTEIRQSDDTPAAKIAVETPSKSICENTPEPSIMESDDSARICCSYLSKLDISLDLAHPELYQQCMNLMGTRDPTDVFDVSKHEYLQNIKENAKAAAKGPSCILESLFPSVTDVVFQRAMSLYTKQNNGVKEKCPALSLFVWSKEEKDVPVASDAEMVTPIDNHTSSEDASLASANSPGNMEEGSNATTDTEGETPGDSKEQQSDTIDALVFVEGSQACEVLIPECRVNLSRIHNSPESTH